MYHFRRLRESRNIDCRGMRRMTAEMMIKPAEMLKFPIIISRAGDRDKGGGSVHAAYLAVERAARVHLPYTGETVWRVVMLRALVVLAV